MAKLSVNDTELSRQFLERAQLQVKCQTEHQRLISLFPSDQSRVEEVLGQSFLGPKEEDTLVARDK